MAPRRFDRGAAVERISQLERRAHRLWKAVSEGTPANQSGSQTETLPVGAGKGEAWSV